MKAIYLAVLFQIMVHQIYGQQPVDSASPKTHYMQEVSVKASGKNMKSHIAATQMGKIDLPVSMLVKVSSIGGEPDIIKALQLTPGVKKGTEGCIGMFVRGGGNDENLILLDGATVYNAGHLLGFFSVFSAPVLKDVQLYKSCFPSQYAGRLSSVLDVKTKDGSLSETKGSASIGAISSSLTLQGPILKDKLSFIVSGRRTYIDKVYKNIPYHFYDVNAKLTYVANEHNRFHLSRYKGDDVLKMSQDNNTEVEGEVKSGMKLGNEVMTLRWNHLQKSYASNITLFYSGFSYNISGTAKDNSLVVRSAIRDIGIKGDIKAYSQAKHQLSSGFNLARHFFNPNIVSSEGALVEKFGNSDGRKIYSYEAGLYINDDYKLSDKWQLNAGMRVSGTLVEDVSYSSPEPRLGLRYLLNDKSSIKASYARMTQYLHLVSSSSLALPTDLWYPVTRTIEPGVSDQVSLGYYHSLTDAGITISAEVYYKQMQRLIEYREGALLALNDNYEKELVKGKGRSYGLEFFASKTAGKFTGWVGYSLSFAHRQFDSLNNGKEYFARYDRRHDLSVVTMYDISKRWSVSNTIVYSSGSPFTGQTSQYVAPKPDLSAFEVLPAYSGRNEMRMSAAFRIDADVCYKFSLGKRIKADAHVGVYNLLNRTQPYKVDRVWDETKSAYKYQQKGLFGLIPNCSLNFNF